MKVGIVIDDWKLAIFARHLTQSGYAFKHGPSGVTPKTTAITVETENRDALEVVCRAAADECARSKV